MKCQFLLTFLLQIVKAQFSSKRCFSTTELDFYSLGAICHGTPSMPTLPCDHAIDYNPATIWHPSSQENLFFELTLNRKVGLKYIEILQNKWPHGYARKVRVSWGKNQRQDYYLMRTENNKWDRIELPRTIWTKYIRLEVLEIEKILFGGLKEIRFFGCGPSLNSKQPSWPTTKKPYWPENNYGDYNEEIVTEESNSGLDWQNGEESWLQTPAAIGFIIGVAVGFIVLIAFLGVSLYACCTKESSNEEEIEEEEEEADEESNLDWNEKSSESGTIIAKSQIVDEDLIEVIEEEDSKAIEDIV